MFYITLQIYSNKIMCYINITQMKDKWFKNFKKCKKYGIVLILSFKWLLNGFKQRKEKNEK